MNTIDRIALALVFAGATSCAAFGSGDSHGPRDERSRHHVEYGYDYGHSAESDVGLFYRELSPYGDWIYTNDYGWTWLPRNVSAGWRPYYYGRWVPSADGWFWVSSEPFGWATYHYGRWASHPRFGWMWVPDRTWGPAWVSWQSGVRYVGWAPLPPEIGFDIGTGLRLGGFNLNVFIPPSAYTFVEQRSFLEREPRRFAVPLARNVTVIRNTTNITYYGVSGGRIVNRGLDVRAVERATGHRLTPMRIAVSDFRNREHVRGNEVQVYRPTQARLDSVHVYGIDSTRDRRQSSASTAHSRNPALIVAPRVNAEQPISDQQRERNQRAQEADRRVFERSQRRRLEDIQRPERETRQASADPAAINHKQAEEKQALETQLQRSRQQHEARQEVAQMAAERRRTNSAESKTQEGKSKGTDKSKGKGNR